LRKFDIVRYGDISLAASRPQNCSTASGDAGSGLAWDVIAQVGALLRSSSKENPLLDLHPHFVIAAGYGDAAAYVTTYANALHAVQRRGDGAPIYDAYLSADGAQLSVPLNQCAAPLPVEDPRRRVLPRDVPFVTVMTETDFNLAPSLRRADSDAPEDVFRLYEIPGASAGGALPAGMPTAADLQIAGIPPAPGDACTEAASDLPVGLVFNAVWQQFADWFSAGHPMLSLSRIETLDDGGPRHDEAGNASGGWRLPQLEEPLGVYAVRTAAACAQGGVLQPFDTAKLKSLYKDRNEYLRRFNAAVDRAVAERRLVAEDGDALKSQQKQVAPAF
jgi:hypothetical protein